MIWYVVFSDTRTEHLIHLEIILKKLREFGLMEKMPKCQWAIAECTYLGHVVGGGQVKPEINKMEAVKNFLYQKQRNRSGHC